MDESSALRWTDLVSKTLQRVFPGSLGEGFCCRTWSLGQLVRLSIMNPDIYCIYVDIFLNMRMLVASSFFHDFHDLRRSPVFHAFLMRAMWRIHNLVYRAHKYNNYIYIYMLYIYP